MKCLLGLVVVAALASPTVAHAEDCLAGGRKLDGKGRHADAIAAWKACLAATPDDPTLEGEIAAAAFQVHDLDVAEQYARVAIAHARDPNLKAGALYTLARVQEERKDTKAAIASYTASLALRASPVVRGRLVALDPKAPIPTAASAAGVVPLGFKTIVEERKAALGMRLVSWWQDDLDADGKDENVAELCNDDNGVYLIEHQGNILVASRTTAGRDVCPRESKPAPSWQTVHRGFIDHTYSVHRASELIHIAVRGHQAVVIYSGEDGTDGQSGLDWDALTTRDNIDHPSAKDLPIVAVADSGARWTSVAKGVALSATVAGDKVVLHVKSAAQVGVSWCSAGQAQPCTKQIAKPVNGVADLTVPDANARTFGSLAVLELEAAGVKSRALVIRADNPSIGGYPSAAAATKK